MNQISKLPKEQRDRQQPLLDELNKGKQPNEQFSLPKYGVDAFLEKAGNWFKKVGSAIKSTITGIGSSIASVFKKAEPPLEITTPTKSEPPLTIYEPMNVVKTSAPNMPPDQAILFITANGKIRTNDEVLQSLKQEAGHLLKNTSDTKNAAATDRIEKLLDKFNAFFKKYQMTKNQVK